MIHSTTLDALPIDDFLTVTDLSRDEIETLLSTAITAKHNPRAYRGLLAGHALAMLFEKPSLRTRMTFEIGFARLGGHPAYVDPKSAQIGQRESLKDCAKNLERWVDVIVARTYAHQTILDLADYVQIPVINALTDLYHPCQALADVLTIAEQFPNRRWNRIALAYIGAGNNVCHSLMLIAATLGMKMTVVTPRGYEPDAEVISRAKKLAQAGAASLTITHELDAIVKHDAVYTDTWVSMGEEVEKETRLKAFADYQVTPKVMSIAGPKAIFMHCLPAYRGCEVVAEVIDGPNSVIFDQAENRMHAQNALLLHLLAPGTTVTLNTGSPPVVAEMSAAG